MAQAVKVSDGEMSALRDAARLHNRSLSGQAEHWMRIGRAVERDPTIGYSRIDMALRGLEPISLDRLGEQEQDAFIEALGSAAPTAAEDDFWRHRRAKGLGVGLDERNRLVHGQARPPRSRG